MANYPKVNTVYAQTKYNVTKCANRKTNKAVKYIVIHNTGTTASAQNNCKYFSGGNRNASADYFINKDGSIYKFNANMKTYYSWHCGDGYGAYGITNYNSIGIEVVSAGTAFTKEQKNALNKLVRALMDDFDVPASRVVRHYDASRKSCPSYYAASSGTKLKRWNELHSYITKEQKVATSTAKKETASKKTMARITASSLCVRKGAGKNYAQVKVKKKNLYVHKNDVFTIIQIKTVDGSKWGKLKSSKPGDPRWINLSCAKVYTVE